MTTPLEPSEFFSIRQNYGLYRPVGKFAKDEIIELIDGAVLYCRENEIGGLLVDITGVAGLPQPSVADLFWFITKFAKTSEGKVAIAMVAPPAMISPDKIGITMAKNRGLRSDVFSNDIDALDWLHSELPAYRLMNG